VDAPHETLRVNLRRAARLGLPHTSADPPPTPSRASGPRIGAAAGAAAPSAPQSSPELLGRRGGRVRTGGGGGGVFRWDPRVLSGHWVARACGLGASTPRGSATSTRTHAGDTRRKPAAERQGSDGLMPPKRSRLLRS